MNDAFLNSLLEEKVHMQHPSWFVNINTSQVWKSNKAINGFKKTHRVYEKLNTTLHNFGFQTIKCDPLLFTHGRPTYTIFMLVFVNDIIVTWSSKSHIQLLTPKLPYQLSIKLLDNLYYLLGITSIPLVKWEYIFISNKIHKISFS